MSLSGILIFLAVMAIVYFLIRYILQQLKAPEPAFVVLNVLFALILLLWLLNFIYPLGIRLR